MKKLMKQAKGFTLIELMIVIAIIAILAAILIPNFIRARAQSQLAACESNLKNIATAVEMYASSGNDDYPASAAVLITNASAPGQALILGGDMQSIPTCPILADTYTYAGVNAPGDYCIGQTANNHAGYVTAGAPGAGGCAHFYPCYWGAQGLMH